MGIGSGLCVLRDPVHRERYKHQQSNDLRTAASHSRATTRRVGSTLVRLVFDVYRDQSNRIPCPERSSKYSSNERDEVDMSELLRYIDTGLQYEDREWDTGDPGNEADDGEDREEEKNDSTGPVFAR
jgi:hypothetical protein